MIDDIKEFFEAYENFLDKDTEECYNILISKYSKLSNTFVREVLNDERYGFSRKRVQQPEEDLDGSDVRQGTQEVEPD